MSNRKDFMNRSCLMLVRRLVAATVIGGMVFAYGVGVGFYKWPPFELLSALKARSPFGRRPYDGEKELLRFAFVDVDHVLWSRFSVIRGQKFDFVWQRCSTVRGNEVQG